MVTEHHSRISTPIINSYLRALSLDHWQEESGEIRNLLSLYFSLISWASKVGLHIRIVCYYSQKRKYDRQGTIALHLLLP